MVRKTKMDAKEALARVSKLTKTVSDGHSKLRHDTGSGPGGHADLTLGPAEART